MGLLDDAIREHLDLKRKRGADPTEIERLEREALGPVRRGPTPRGADGVPHLEVQPEPHQAGARPGDFHVEDDPTVLHGAPVETPLPEPKRGFLRRHRPAVEAEQAPSDFTQHLDAEFHDQPPVRGHVEPLEAHEPHDHIDIPTEAHEAEPPPLTFESPPPTRPTFTSAPTGEEEIVTGEPVLDEPAAPHADTAHQDVIVEHVEDQPTELHDAVVLEDEPHTAEPVAPPPAPPPAPSHPAPAPAVPVDLGHREPGETREWDVADAFAAEDVGHQPDPSSDAEEDVLEETPEFLQDTPDHDRLWFEQRPPRDFDFDG